jgi:thioesterase domain-containing protein
MTDIDKAPGQPDAQARLKSLSQDKQRLLEAMMRQRAAEAPRREAEMPPAGGPRFDSRPWPDMAPPQPQPQPQARPTPDPRPKADFGPGMGAGMDPAASLVAIKASGTLPPFFCVHAMLGSAFPYFRLALRLDPEQPFYGLQSPGLDGVTPPLESIEAMASHYIGLIRGVQPHGPYYIGGYSFGGWVAFEMAQQLAEVGETVALLAVLGTGAPPSMSNPRLFEQINYMAQYSDDYRRLFLNSFMSDAARSAPPSPLPGGVAAPGQSPLAVVAAVNNAAQFRYVPRPYGDRITLFVTGEQHAAAFPETTLGWKMLSVKQVPVHLVSGNHLSMFEEPHVSDLAGQLSACLRQRQKEFGAVG